MKAIIGAILGTLAACAIAFFGYRYATAPAAPPPGFDVPADMSIVAMSMDGGKPYAFLVGGRRGARKYILADAATSRIVSRWQDAPAKK